MSTSRRIAALAATLAALGMGAVSGVSPAAASLPTPTLTPTPTPPPPPTTICVSEADGAGPLYTVTEVTATAIGIDMKMPAGCWTTPVFFSWILDDGAPGGGSVGLRQGPLATHISIWGLQPGSTHHVELSLSPAASSPSGSGPGNIADFSFTTLTSDPSTPTATPTPTPTLSPTPPSTLPTKTPAPTPSPTPPSTVPTITATPTPSPTPPSTVPTTPTPPPTTSAPTPSPTPPSTQPSSSPVPVTPSPTPPSTQPTVTPSPSAPTPTASPIPTLSPTPVPTPPWLCVDPYPGWTEGPRVIDLTPTSAQFQLIRFGCAAPVASISTYLDGELVQTLQGPTYPQNESVALTGLTPSTTYHVKVVSHAYDGTDTELVSDFQFTTPARDQATEYGASGPLLLRTSTATGSFALRTSVQLTAPASGAGAVTGALRQTASVGTLRLAGFIPVTAQISLGGGAISGTANGSTFSGTTSTSVAITKATVLGLTLTQGGTCHTTADPRIALTSTGAFSVADGGTLTGTFSVPKFTGCGGLGAFLGTTGARSSIALKLVPLVPAAS